MKFSNIFNGKKVIVTGHTGFKGSWLSLWLNSLGAKVIGLSINIPSNPSHFKAIKLQNKIKHIKMDIRNLKMLKKDLPNEGKSFLKYMWKMVKKIGPKIILISRDLIFLKTC